MNLKWTTLAALSLGAVLLGAVPTLAQTQTKPNILIIWGDDIGEFNISAYNMGRMGYRTPNIDRIAKEGAIFTDWYGQQSCTAGRAAFITGQSPIRTGLTKVGVPGATQGLQPQDPTIADLLKPLGYATGQFGKNHVGDRNEFLPTVHGFDEFFGILYHLNAMEEPENVNYPKDPKFRERFGPRNIIRTVASDKDDATVDPRFGRVGKQVIEDAGPLTIERMKRVDTEFAKATMDFMEKNAKAGKPFFVWHNSTRTHVFTHLSAEWEGKTGLGIYADAMSEHDSDVGKLLAKLKELGIEDNTIVMYATDNGAETFTWPDGRTTIYRGEKNTQWEGGYRVPCMMRWPGVIKPGMVINDIGAHEDMMETLLAAAGYTTAKEDLLKGKQYGDKTFKVHLDGYNLLPALKGESEWPRKEFLYWTDDGSVAALRYNDWKLTFLRQNSIGFKVWETPFEDLRWPMLTNLRMDPLERAYDDSANYTIWAAKRMFVLEPAGGYIAQWLSSFRDFPPRQKPGSFNLDRVMEKMTEAHKGSN